MLKAKNETVKDCTGSPSNGNNWDDGMAHLESGINRLGKNTERKEKGKEDSEETRQRHPFQHHNHAILKRKVTNTLKVSCKHEDALKHLGLGKSNWTFPSLVS